MSDALKITWFGHSCFRVETQQGYSVVLDPYEDGSVPGFHLPQLTADQVLCSHEHHDHNARHKVSTETSGAAPFRIQVIDAYHDDQKGALRGSSKIHILEHGAFRLAHLGDLGCELSPKELEPLQNLDVLFIPVGGYYTIGAAQARRLADKANARIVVPMHYRGPGFGYDELAELKEYTKLCDHVVHYPDHSLTVTKDTPRQTAVLE